MSEPTISPQVATATTRSAWARRSAESGRHARKRTIQVTTAIASCPRSSDQWSIASMAAKKTTIAAQKAAGPRGKRTGRLKQKGVLRAADGSDGLGADEAAGGVGDVTRGDAYRIHELVGRTRGRHIANGERDDPRA